ncbi:hypothetical protein ACFL0W_06295 [Nanoarchaeota archaeon]
MLFSKHKKEEDMDEIQDTEEGQETSAGPPPGADAGSMMMDAKAMADLEKIKAKLEVGDEFRKANTERFSRISEEIGELRNSIMDMQKQAEKVSIEAAKASDLVEAVQPQTLMREVQREDAKIEATRAEIKKEQELAGDVQKRLKDLKKTVDVFKGAESLLKLESDIREELVGLRKLQAMVERHSEKTENIFVEFQREYSDFLKYKDMAKSIQDSSDGTLEELDKIKAKVAQVITEEKFKTFEENMNNQLLSGLNAINGFKEEMAEFSSKIPDTAGQFNELKENLNESTNLLKSQVDAIEQKIPIIDTELPKKLQGHSFRLGNTEARQQKMIVDMNNIKKWIKVLIAAGKARSVTKGTKTQTSSKYETEVLLNKIREEFGDDIVSKQDEIADNHQSLQKELNVQARQLESMKNQFSEFIKKDMGHLEGEVSKLKGTITDDKGILHKSIDDITKMLKTLPPEESAMIFAKLTARVNHLVYLIDSDKKTVKDKIYELGKKSEKNLSKADAKKIEKELKTQQDSLKQELGKITDILKSHKNSVKDDIKSIEKEVRAEPSIFKEEFMNIVRGMKVQQDNLKQDVQKIGIDVSKVPAISKKDVNSMIADSRKSHAALSASDVKKIVKEIVEGSLKNKLKEIEKKVSKLKTPVLKKPSALKSKAQPKIKILKPSKIKKQKPKTDLKKKSTKQAAKSPVKKASPAVKKKSAKAPKKEQSKPKEKKKDPVSNSMMQMKDQIQALRQTLMEKHDEILSDSKQKDDS